MAAFRSLTSDREPLEAFKLAAFRSYNSEQNLFKANDTDLPLHLFEWSQASQDGVEIMDVRSVTDLEARNPSTVRVV